MFLCFLSNILKIIFDGVLSFASFPNVFLTQNRKSGIFVHFKCRDNTTGKMTGQFNQGYISKDHKSGRENTAYGIICTAWVFWSS